MTKTAKHPAASSRRRGRYTYPPGMSRNLLWFALSRVRPRNPIILFEQLAAKYGPICHYKVGPQHIVFLNDSEYIYEILAAQNDNFTKERTVQRSKLLLGEGMITAEAADHKRQRRAAQPAFHRQRIGEYAEAIVSNAVRAREGWKHGARMDVAQEMMRLSLDNVASTLFSTELREDIVTVVEAINEIMRLYRYLVALPAIEVLLQVPATRLKGFTKAKRRLDEVVFRMIRRRRKHPGKGDLLDMLLASESDEQKLRDEVITIFLAGYETVANALTWTWYLLSQNPEAEQRLHREIDALGGRRLGMGDLKQLAYTEMVLAESMRLYPPAWAMGRKARQDFHLGEWFLPKGTTVLMSQWVTHRNARYYAEPLAFRPERFTAEAKAERARFSYFPFGAGPRQCIGESFAWMEAVLVLAAIAQRWQFRLVEGHRVEPEPLITLRPRYGMMMEAERRR